MRAAPPKKHNETDEPARGGLGFTFSKDQDSYRERIKLFAGSEIAPRRREWDHGRKNPWPLIQQAAQQGLLSPMMDYVTRGITVEEVGYADFNCALPFLLATLPYRLFELPGIPDEIRNSLLDGMAAGEKVIGVCFTEPAAGSDMSGFEATAELDGDTWVINAVKNSISWADADAYIVTCRTAEGGQGTGGLTNFLILRGAAGVGRPEICDDLGSRAVARGTVRFENVRIPTDHVVGEVDRAYPMVAQFFDTNRAYIGLKCIGAAQASVDETCRFAKERISMGKSISRYQGVSFPLAEAETLLEAGRLLCYKTLWMEDAGIRHSREGAMVKWWVPELAFEIVRKCLTLHGHYGYTSDLPFEQRLRDILGWQIGDGTAEISKLLIARGMMGREFVG